MRPHPAGRSPVPPAVLPHRVGAHPSQLRALAPEPDVGRANLEHPFGLMLRGSVIHRFEKHRRQLAHLPVQPVRRVGGTQCSQPIVLAQHQDQSGHGC